MAFADHFSGHADAYRRYRPTYPQALFAYLAAEAPTTTRAWDCATGNGQAAVALADHFEEVVASDASDAQLAQATAHRRVRYVTAPAESSPCDDASCDLVSVAQAYHWFRHQDFLAEARRVLRPGGVLCIWSYSLHHCEASVDAVVRRFYEDVVGPYWPAERKHVENAYRDLPFHFERFDTPAFSMQAEWSLEHLVGYLGSWSATQRFTAAEGKDPIPAVANELGRVWGNASTRTVHWPLVVLAGRRG